MKIPLLCQGCNICVDRCELDKFLEDNQDLMDELIKIEEKE